MGPGTDEVDKRWLVRLWRVLDYVLWLPLGTGPQAVQELQELIERHSEFVESWQDENHKRVMPVMTLARLVCHEAGNDLLVAFRLFRRLNSDSKWVYWVADPLMVYLVLPALFILTGLALGGPGVYIGAALFGVLWLILAQRVRACVITYRDLSGNGGMVRASLSTLPDPSGGGGSGTAEISELDGSADDETRLLVSDAFRTLPNAITLVRLVALGFFPFLLGSSGQPHNLRAAVFLGALASTDWADGFVARHYGAQSRLGEMLDPTTDRLMMIVVVASMWKAGFIPPVLSEAILFREAMTVLCGVILFRPKSLSGGPRVSVSSAGKIGFLALNFGLVILLVASKPPWILAAGPAIAGLIMGTALQYYALITYISKALRPKI